MIRTRAYKDGALEASDFDPALVSDYLEHPNTFVWLDLPSPSRAELKMIQEEFDLHPLALEDAEHPHQRPKVDRYSNHLFIVLYAVRLKDSTVERSEVDVFLSERFMVTVRKRPSWPIEPVIERWDRAGDGLASGIWVLLHGLLDVVVDQYLSVADDLREGIEEAGDNLVEHERMKILEQDFLEKRGTLGAFRRTVHPFMQAMETLLAGDLPDFPNESLPYFEDVRDHLRRSADAIEGAEETLTGALNLHLLLASNRLNDIMKKLTGWAAILAVATTIAGIYGMNFQLFPRGDHPYGFWLAVGMIFASSAALYIYFQRKDWL